MKKKNLDILAIKSADFEKASKEADDAVVMVSTAMNRLKSANQKMANDMKSIEEYCAAMMSLHSGIEKSYAHNEAVISNFAKLLCVEE